MEQFKEFLEIIGLDPISVLSIVVALVVISSLLKLNPLGIGDRLKKILRVPTPPGQDRPSLKRDVDIIPRER